MIVTERTLPGGSPDEKQLYLLRIAADGTPDPAPIPLEQGADAYFDLAATALPDGGYALSWREFNRDDTDGDSYVTVAFDADGTERNRTAEDSVATRSTLQLGVTPDGGIRHVWTEQTFGDDDQTLTIYIDDLQSDAMRPGTLPAPVFITAAELGTPRALTLSDGAVVVTFQTVARATGPNDGDTFSLHELIVDTDGSLRAPARVVAEGVRPNAFATTALTDGGYVQVWRDQTDAPNIYTAQIIDAQGHGQTPLPVLLGNPDGSRAQVDAPFLQRADVLPSGNLMLIWDRYIDLAPPGMDFDGLIWAIEAQEFTPDLTALGEPEVLIEDAKGRFIQVTFGPDDEMLLFHGDGSNIQTARFDVAQFDTYDDSAQNITARDGTGAHLQGGDDVFIGTVQDDAATGGAGQDTMQGGGGADRFHGGTGDDFLLGEAGDDMLRGGSGDDRVLGGAGGDTLRGDDGRDILNGGADDDFIFGGDSSADLSDTIFAGDGDDRVDAGYGNDIAYGGAGRDTMLGSWGSDQLIGQDGDDALSGQALSDLIFGGAGDDFIDGGFGFDRLNGGDGADRFFHMVIADHGSDWVQDYSAAQGDVLVAGRALTPDMFQVNFAETRGAGADGVAEAFVIFRPTEQIVWALVDGAEQDTIDLRIAGQTFDLLI